jgi:hypothetical protein
MAGRWRPFCFGEEIMKLPKIEIDNQILVSAIKSIANDLNPDEVIKIEIDEVGRENSKDIIIKVRTEPKSGEGWFKQHFETGQKLNISFK